MNNYIIISKTFTEITPESCENGDFSNQGFLVESENVTFSELVGLMKEHGHPSQSPNGGNIDVWYSCDCYISDYSTYTEREESIHFHRDNSPNAAKYWKLAAKFAGLLK